MKHRTVRWTRRSALLALLLLVVAVVVGTGSASATRPTTTSGPLRVDLFLDLDNIDPALAYGLQSWQLEFATCAKLVNYPGEPAPERNAPLSRDRRRIPDDLCGRTDLHVPDPQRLRIFATRNGRRHSPEHEVHVRANGAPGPAIAGLVLLQQHRRTRGVSRRAAQRHQRHRRQRKHADDLAHRAAGELPHVPRDAVRLRGSHEPAPDPAEAPIPSAGPYYISQRHAWLRKSSRLRNPNYTGPRLRRFDSIEYTIGHTLEEIRQRVESGVSDYSIDLPSGSDEELAPLYGPDSPAAGRGLQQWFSSPASCLFYHPLNTERPLFADPNMRKAVNFALDRVALGELSGHYSYFTTDQYLPPGFPGFSDIDVYPDHPDIERARELADWQPGDPLRPGVLYYGTARTRTGSERSTSMAQLLQIGIDLTMVGFQGFEIYERDGPPRRALRHRHRRVVRGLPRPLGLLFQLDGTTIQDGEQQRTSPTSTTRSSTTGCTPRTSSSATRGTSAFAGDRARSRARRRAVGRVRAIRTTTSSSRSGSGATTVRARLPDGRTSPRSACDPRSRSAT